MGYYVCCNRGSCNFADGRNRFSWSGSGSPVCPVCGRSEYVSPADSAGIGRSPKFALIIGITLVLLLLGYWVLGFFGKPPTPVPNPVGPAPEVENPSSVSTPVDPIREREPFVAIPPVEEKRGIPELTIKLTDQESAAIQYPANSLPVPYPELFGLIEIGSKGVKAIVIDLLGPETTPKCQRNEETLAKCVLEGRIKKFVPNDVNPVEPGAIPDTVKAARIFYDEMVQKCFVDPRKIYLVASSSVSEAPHREQLRKALGRELDQTGKVEFLTPEKEGQYDYEGVLNLIPRKWRDRRRKQAVLIDVGSGNTKGGFLKLYKEAPGDPFVALSFPWGTKTFFREVKNRKRGAGFQEFAGDLRNRLLRPVIKDLINRKPAISNRTRIYLIGGIAWATSTFEHPRSKLQFPPLKPRDFDSLYRRVTAPNALSKLCDNNPDKIYTEDIAKVCDIFSMNELIAGLEILRTLSEELEVKSKNKKIFFFRDSLYAWPLGYMKARCQKEKTCQISEQHELNFTRKEVCTG